MALRHKHRTRTERAAFSAWVASLPDDREVELGNEPAANEGQRTYVSPYGPPKPWARNQAPIELRPVRKITKLVAERAKFLIGQALGTGRLEAAGVQETEEESTARISAILDNTARHARRAVVMFRQMGSPLNQRTGRGARRTNVPGRPALVRIRAILAASLTRIA